MAPRVESVNLLEFAGEESPLPPNVAKRAAFYGDLARFATIIPSDRVRRTPVGCRRRPGRKPCPGLIDVRRRDVPPLVDWECSVCAARGSISGWEETEADLRDLRDDTERIAAVILVSLPVHAALRDAARTRASLRDLVYGAKIDEESHPLLLARPAECRKLSRVVMEAALMASSRSLADRLYEVANELMAVAESGIAERISEAQDSATSEAATGLLDQGGDLPDAEPMPAQPRPQRAAPKPRTYQIKVTLRDVKPPVWRRLKVPSDIELPALHGVLQTAMGWLDCHLHLFRAGDRTYAPAGDFEALGDDTEGVTLEDLAPGEGSRVRYEYDFGDDWSHDIVVEDVSDEPCAAVRCLAGRRRCPPEDCGGAWGYAEFCEALVDPLHERHAELREWIGGPFDPDEFDVREVDAELQDAPVRPPR